MIKHAEGRYLSSELTMHFGLIPRTNRGIFCINELPDLAPKIQVGLFNVLEERDVQIRGYPVRLDLDLCMVFSANPEDYTNRGRIVTPLKDRIGSVVRTHYPLTREIGIAISDQNAWLERDGTTADAGDPDLHQGDRRGDRRGWPGRRRTSTSSRASRSGCRSPTWRTWSPTPSGGRSSTASAGSSRGSPTWLRASRQLARQARADDDRGRRPRGQADRRIVDEAVKNVFAQHLDVREFRPIVDYFESGQSVEVGDTLPAKAVLERIAKVPGLRKRAEELAAQAPARPHRRATPARPPPPAPPSSSSKGCTCTTS